MVSVSTNKGTFLTVSQQNGPAELKEKGSHFLAYVCPVSSAASARQQISLLRKKHHDATHVCFAFRLGQGSESLTKFNDDGEPSGTAGRPILCEITGLDLYNVLVAVVRYYGGTKLGTGGLVRAYGAAARMVLNQSSRTTVVVKRSGRIDFPFHLTGEVHRLVDKFAIEVVAENHGDSGTSMVVRIPDSAWDQVQQSLLQFSASAVQLVAD